MRLVPCGTALASIAAVLTCVTACAGVPGDRARSTDRDRIALGGRIIWQSRSAQRDAYALISQLSPENPNPHPLRPYEACVLGEDTRVVVTQFGETSHDVLVLEGREAGGRGVRGQEIVRVP